MRGNGGKADKNRQYTSATHKKVYKMKKRTKEKKEK